MRFKWLVSTCLTRFAIAAAACLNCSDLGQAFGSGIRKDPATSVKLCQLMLWGSKYGISWRTVCSPGGFQRLEGNAVGGYDFPFVGKRLYGVKTDSPNWLTTHCKVENRVPINHGIMERDLMHAKEAGFPTYGRHVRSRVKSQVLSW